MPDWLCHPERVTRRRMGMAATYGIWDAPYPRAPNMVVGMTVQLPAFRLQAPPLPEALVPRPRVEEMILSTAPGGTCVVTCAPGYGATTALRQAMRSQRCAWVALDSTVTDAQARGLLAAAVGAARVGVDDALEALATHPGDWVVLDGLVPQAHPVLLQDLTALVQRLPASVRVAVSAHQRIGPFARAVALSEEDLAFDADESLSVIQAIAPRVDIEDAEVVISAADGWAAALVTGATHMRVSSARPWPTDEVAAGLLGSWFADLPQRLQEFLIATSVLTELAAGPAAAVTGDPEAAELLLELEAAHAYLRPILGPEGRSGRWWRRHPLLTALLLQHSDAGRIAAHSAAAEWFMAAGDIPRSMHHLIASGRSQDAGRFLTDHEAELLAKGRADQILQWYDQIGAGYHDRIGHLIRVGWGQALSYDIRGADATLALIAAELTARKNAVDLGAEVADDSWSADEALLRGYLAGFHADPATMVSAGRRALETHPDAVLTSDAAQLAPLVIVRGMLFSGQYESAQHLMQAFADRPFPNDLIREVRLAGLRAQVAFENGYVTRAAADVDAAGRWLERMNFDQNVLRNFTPLQASASVEMERGNWDEAVTRATSIAERSEATGNLSEAAWAWLTVARTHTLRGDYSAAFRRLSQARALATADTPDTGMLVPLNQAQALAHLLAGDPVRAERLIGGLPPGAARSMLWARAGLTRQPAMARRTLEATRGRSPRLESQRHLLLACLHLRSSPRMAQGHLRKAAAIAAANGLSQLLAPPMPDVHEFARDTALEYQDDDLLWLLKTGTSGARDREVPEFGSTLSRGELQLLAFLPTRARNADIADSLGISVNTVKTRLRRLYAKLHAGNRDEAIARARERGLLEA